MLVTFSFFFSFLRRLFSLLTKGKSALLRETLSNFDSDYKHYSLLQQRPTNTRKKTTTTTTMTAVTSSPDQSTSPANRDADESNSNNATPPAQTGTLPHQEGTSALPSAGSVADQLGDLNASLQATAVGKSSAQSFASHTTASPSPADWLKVPDKDQEMQDLQSRRWADLSDTEVEEDEEDEHWTPPTRQESESLVQPFPDTPPLQPKKAAPAPAPLGGDDQFSSTMPTQLKKTTAGPEEGGERACAREKTPPTPVPAPSYRLPEAVPPALTLAQKGTSTPRSNPSSSQRSTPNPQGATRTHQPYSLSPVIGPQQPPTADRHSPNIIPRSRGATPSSSPSLTPQQHVVLVPPIEGDWDAPYRHPSRLTPLPPSALPLSAPSYVKTPPPAPSTSRAVPSPVPAPIGTASASTTAAVGFSRGGKKQRGGKYQQHQPQERVAPNAGAAPFHPRTSPKGGPRHAPHVYLQQQQQGGWNTVHGPVLGELLEFVPFPAVGYDSDLPMNHNLAVTALRNRRVAGSAPTCSCPVEEGSAAALSNAPISRLFVGHWWKHISTEVFQWLLDTFVSDLAREGDHQHCIAFNSQPHVERSTGKFKGCLHVNICSVNPSLVTQALHHRVLFDLHGVWYANTPQQKDLLDDYCLHLRSVPQCDRHGQLQTLPPNPLACEFSTN